MEKSSQVKTTNTQPSEVIINENKEEIKTKEEKKDIKKKQRNLN